MTTSMTWRQLSQYIASSMPERFLDQPVTVNVHSNTITSLIHTYEVKTIVEGSLQDQLGFWNEPHIILND